MPRLCYQGHASVRLISDAGIVAYLDPFAGQGYDLPADIILVTHQHEDHNRVDMVLKNPKCRIITEQQALVNGTYRTLRPHGVIVQATPATNEFHDPRECVGYLITMDDVRIYFAGDTEETDAMREMVFLGLDYALLPVDGKHSMDVFAASICAARIGARHSIPVSTKAGVLFDENIARRFDVPGRLILRPGEEIDL